MRKTLLAFGALLLAACGGGGGMRASDVAPLASPDAAVREFLAAVQDSNISRMGRSWGSNSGPAAVTNTPPQWEQRMKVVQVYLAGGTYRITGNTPANSDGKHRNIAVEFTRGSCVKQLPFVAVQTKAGGWLVEAIDISAAGNPGNPCPAVPGSAPANP